MLKIQVINRQKLSRVSPKRMESLGRFVLQKEGIERSSCAVVLLDDASLAGFHKDYLGEKKNTDVISFPFHEKEQDGTCYLGDVLVSVERARVMATAFNNSFTSELDLYVIHGILHLLGYDDVGKRKRNIMKKREVELWSAWRRLQITKNRG